MIQQLYQIDSPANDRSVARRVFRIGIASRILLLLPVAVLALNDRQAFGTDDGPIRIAPRLINAAEVGVGRLTPPLQAQTVSGKSVSIDNCRDYPATVVALTSTSCPLCKKYLPSLAKLEKEYESKGVRFVFVNCVASDAVEEMKDAIEVNQLSGAYIHDADQSICAALRATTTTEVFVLDAARTLVYRGAVDDQYGLGYSLGEPRKTYLRDALDNVLSSQSVAIAATTSPGCTLDLSHVPAGSSSENPTLKSATKSDADKSVTYHNQISRIVQQNCVECHRESGLAPFSLETAEDVISHAGMIQTVVRNGTMPPWFAKEESKSRWANDRSLLAKSKNEFLTWLSSSERELGDQSQAPVKRKFESEWNIGEPDFTAQIPRRISVKATGTMKYQYAVVRPDFDNDKWVTAVEIRPTDRSVVHHVLVFINDGNGRKRVDETSGFFAAYVPGNSYQIYPEGFAKKLPAGSTLVFQLHYTPIGKKTTDQTRIGLKFTDDPPPHVIRNKGIANTKIKIPAGAENHPEEASLPVPVDVRLLSFMPHMHLRGKAFRYDVVSGSRNSRKRETILDVPRYDFNWQLEYRLAEPLLVKAGSRIEVTGWYDNSAGNPANPDPTRTVKWGPQTDDEMMLGYVEYYIPGEKAVGSDNQDAGQKSRSNGTARNRSRRGEALSAAIATRAFRKYDVNQDGKVTREELNRPQMFDSLNKNGDDYLTLDELVRNEK